MKPWKRNFVALTIDDIDWDAVETILDVGGQYQFKDSDPGSTIILDPAVHGEEDAIAHTKQLVENWTREEIEPGVIRYTRPQV